MASLWQPHGHCHKFESSTVERMVPAVSGVFGLHNRRQQLFIGEASDLREALLQQSKDSEKLFRGRQPKFFSFEVCDADRCASRAQVLIAEYRPSIQALKPLSSTALPRTKSQGQATDIGESSGKNAAPTPQWPEASITSESNTTRQPSYFSRAQLTILGLSFVVTATAAAAFGLISGKKIAETRQAALQSAAARRPALAHTTGEASQPLAPIGSIASDVAPVESGRSPENAAAIPPLRVTRATARDDDAPAAAKAKNNLEADAVKASRTEIADAKQAVALARKKQLAANPWSVQISATKDQSAAQLLQDKLKSKGFDAFIVEAEINSAQWYRVRVGRFSTNQEAEKARQDLQSKENLASAFVTDK